MIKFFKRSFSLWLIICMTVTLIPLAGLTAAAATTPRIYVDGQRIETDADPYIENDRTMVPVALIVNAVGGTSEWEESTRAVTLTYEDKVVGLHIGSMTMTLNGVSQQMDVAPCIKDVKDGYGGRTMVPVRFVSEAFGFTVGWDGNTTSVYIETGKQPVSDMMTIRSVSLQANQKYDVKYYTYVTINADKSLRDAMNEGHWLSNPCRFYIDFNDAEFASGVKAQQYQIVEGSRVTGVRVGKVTETNQARVVVDLTSQQQPNISFSESGREMTLAFEQNDYQKEQTWTPGDHDTTTVQGTRKYDTISKYHPYADGRLVVAIDPGHGKTTGGKRSFDSSLMEWEFNRDVAYRLKDILESNGIECVMTVAWDDTTDPSLATRCEIANRDDSVDLFVSIHANAYGSTWNTANGWEVYSYQKGGVSELAAKFIEQAKNAAITEIRDRGNFTANFYVIKNTEMPAVLIEHAFYTNKTEVEYLKSDSFRDRFAQADAEGIINFFNYFK